MAGAGSALALKFFRMSLYESTQQKIYADRIIEILKTNLTLHTVLIEGLLLGFLEPEQEKLINYYTSLNRFGRALVQDPEIPLQDVVEKIARLNLDTKYYDFPLSPCYYKCGVPVLYGILREVPGKWIDHVVEAERKREALPNCSLKRKASA
ncbi:expressed unknown protein [Seminavis robusta]|uniref:Uncharacterized protein n=1 Tax=Seminavis robusta TaxID=568900 RepID=A0A9N8EZL0_9STRA|nr:expressed unknown protein [Seminavis robusta]|eukprot:Sro2333_g323680.1 n/a (152) ;mRNA; f:2605-3060